MSLVEWSQPQDLECWIRRGLDFVCEACPCGETRLFVVGDYIIAECPHIVIRLDADGVTDIHGIGIRQ